MANSKRYNQETKEKQKLVSEGSLLKLKTIIGLSALEQRAEYDATCQDKKLCITDTKDSHETVSFWENWETEISKT